MKAHGTTTAVRWNAATTLVMTGSQMLQVILLARWLTPAEFGLAAVAVSIAVSLQSFCDLGLTNALVQREHVSKEGWSSAWWATAAAGVALGLAIMLLSIPLEAGLRLPGLERLLVVAALVLPLYGPASVCQAHLQRHLRFRRLAVADMGGAFSAMFVAVLWGHFTRGAGALVAAQVALVAVRFILLWILSRFRFQWRASRDDLRPLFGFGGYQMGERAVQFLGSNLDRVLVARLLGPVATGYYAMASQLALRPAALLGPFISRTLLPLMARMQAHPPRMIAAYLRSLSMLGFVSALVYGLLFGLAHPLVLLVLGPKWEAAVLTLRILSVVGFLNVLGNTLEILLLSLAHARTGFWLNVGMLASRFTALSLGAQFGLTGMTLALAILTVLWLPFDLWLPRAWLGIPMRDTAVAGGWVFLPGILTAACVAFVAARLQIAPALEVLLLAPGGALFFLGIAWLLHRRRLAAVIAEVRSHLP